ncbi:elongation factor Tu, partial [Streptomyces sp. SID5770]|uniref:EF-Tu/IF-2/RF-3 family GTPase n=1 Tax=Streptomyces sp. SID5770 TaxID=2690308 RepID=UPI001382E9A9|nr:elongation factor Tu [Streptomyces sp. SID5770]
MDESVSIFRMPVSHVFLVPRGTVLLGTVETGVVHVGDIMEIIEVEGGERWACYVRGIEVYRKDVAEGKAGEQVGVFVDGVDYRQIPRACIL